MSQFTNWKRWDNSQNVAVPNPALWNLSTLHFGQFAVDKLQLIYVDVFSHMRLCFKTGLPSACKLDFDPSLFSPPLLKHHHHYHIFFVLIYDHHGLRCQWAAARHAGAKLKYQNLFVIIIRSGQVRPARQTAEPFQGASATCIHSTWYLVET